MTNQGGNEGEQFPGTEWLQRARKSPKIPQVLSSIQCICFRKTSDLNMGVPNLLLAPVSSEFLTSRHVRIHRVIFYISNTLKKLMT